ncbi:MAG TPA: AgmX/PglI C-terminal domain-containing protein [Polyangiaceae bacterium]
MSQEGVRLRCRSGLSPGLTSRALFQVAVPLAASVVAHGAVVAAFTGRGAAPVVSTESPADWVEAPEPVKMEPVAPDEAPGEEGSEGPASPAAQTREPESPVDLPPPDAIPGAHAGAPLSGKERAAWWEAAKKVQVGPFDGPDNYKAIRAHIAGWNPKLVTGTYVPGGRGVAHPEEMPSRRVPAAAIASVIQANMDRFRVCHGAGLPKSATISGEVLVTFDIEPDGHVSGPRDTGGTFPDDAVRQCVVRAVAQLSFAKPPEVSAQQVTIRVTLQAEEARARPDLDPVLFP